MTNPGGKVRVWQWPAIVLNQPFTCVFEAPFEVSENEAYVRCFSLKILQTHHHIDISNKIVSKRYSHYFGVSGVEATTWVKRVTRRKEGTRTWVQRVTLLNCFPTTAVIVSCVDRNAVRDQEQANRRRRRQNTRHATALAVREAIKPSITAYAGIERYQTTGEAYHRRHALFNKLVGQIKVAGIKVMSMPSLKIGTLYFTIVKSTQTHQNTSKHIMFNCNCELSICLCSNSLIMSSLYACM